MTGTTVCFCELCLEVRNDLFLFGQLAVCFFGCCLGRCFEIVLFSHYLCEVAFQVLLGIFEGYIASRCFVKLGLHFGTDFICQSVVVLCQGFLQLTRFTESGIAFNGHVSQSGSHCFIAFLQCRVFGSEGSRLLGHGLQAFFHCIRFLGLQGEQTFVVAYHRCFGFVAGKRGKVLVFLTHCWISLLVNIRLVIVFRLSAGRCWLGSCPLAVDAFAEFREGTDSVDDCTDYILHLEHRTVHLFFLDAWAVLLHRRQKLVEVFVGFLGNGFHVATVAVRTILLGTLFGVIFHVLFLGNGIHGSVLHGEESGVHADATDFVFLVVGKHTVAHGREECTATGYRAVAEHIYFLTLAMDVVNRLAEVNQGSGHTARSAAIDDVTYHIVTVGSFHEHVAHFE